MTIFKKYPSIENHYQQKRIDKWLNIFPELQECDYAIQEKIHGANLQLIFNPNQSEKYVIATRNRCLPSDESFYGVRDILNQEKYVEMINYFDLLSKEENKIIHVYGELYGDGIQKGVKYDEKSFRIFDIAIGDDFISPIELNRINIPISNDLTIDMKIVKGLENALNYDCNIETIYGSGICEGIVIKPISYQRFNKFNSEYLGSVFYTKKKNDAFLEREKAPREKTQEEINAIKHRELFKEYITENRLQNLFSKEGIIQSNKDIGRYIALMIEDAKEDFFKDNEGEYHKSTFNVGKDIKDMLEKYL